MKVIEMFYFIRETLYSLKANTNNWNVFILTSEYLHLIGEGMILSIRSI